MGWGPEEALERRGKVESPMILAMIGIGVVLLACFRRVFED